MTRAILQYSCIEITYLTDQKSDYKAHNHWLRKGAFRHITSLNNTHSIEITYLTEKNISDQKARNQSLRAGAFCHITFSNNTQNRKSANREPTHQYGKK